MADGNALVPVEDADLVLQASDELENWFIWATDGTLEENVGPERVRQLIDVLDDAFTHLTGRDPRLMDPYEPERRPN